MKIYIKYTTTLIILIAGFFLCGFETGVQIGDPAQSQEPTDVPVVEYEETVTAVKSDLELYQQYYVIIVSSLEDAIITLEDNILWAYRMTDNAFRYMNLLEKFIDKEQTLEFQGLKDELNPIVVELKAGNISKRQVQEIQKSFTHIIKSLKNDFSRKNVEQVKE